MHQHSESMESRPTKGDGEGEIVDSRWKVSSRILRMLQEDRRDASKQDDPWRSRGARVPQRDALSGVAPRLHVANGDEVDDRDDDGSQLPAWLISLIVHMVLVLAAALWHLPVATNGAETLRLTLNPNVQPDGTPSLVVASESVLVTDPEVTEMEDSAAKGPVSLPEMAVPVQSPRSVQTNPDEPSTYDSLLGYQSGISLATSFSGGQLGDRSAQGRAAAVSSGETTGPAEDALELALKWIALHQHNDGGWSFRLSDQDGPCHGQCDNPIVNTEDAPLPRTAATGLALLAFMGAGSTHQSGPYAENVRRGIYYLRSQARPTSLGTDLQNGSMYGHGIATLALAEAYVLTSDPDLREFLEDTTFLCYSAQHPSGGWGYMPGGPPDITLTAWQVIAIKTAEQRKIPVPTSVIPDAKKFVATLRDTARVKYGYKTPEPKLSTTAIGILLQLYFGALPGQTEIREGLDWIAAEGPSRTNVYYNYYAMLAMHHSRHQASMEFAKNLRDHLLATQWQEGHQRGSWHFPDRYGSVGGRFYTTAMCALILETPYRYVPLYGN
jgi:hypothetical protein